MNEESTQTTNKISPKPKAKKTVRLNKQTLLIGSLIILVLAAVGGSVFWGLNQSNKAKSTASRLNDLDAQKQQLVSRISSLEKELEQRKETTGEANIDKEAFQSVFLKTGQVYFGKITAISENQMTLENIYYLKDNGGGDTSLIKLGSELHGPQDKMFIERKDLSFWENLKNDSEVTTAINEYEKQNP